MLRLFFCLSLIVLLCAACNQSTREDNKCAIPTFNPAGGTYTTAQSVTIACATINTTVIYTTDGSNPDSNSPVYSEPIEIPYNTVMTIKAQSYRDGWNDSQVATATYQITGRVATPVIQPGNGTYTTAQNVSINCGTSGATIHYTIDDSEPSETSPVYTNPIQIESNCVVKAKAYKTDWITSFTAHATYVFMTAIPNFNPPGGYYHNQSSVAINCQTPGTSIHYTMDGSDPSLSSPIYIDSLSIITNTTLKAMSTLNGVTSPINSNVYFITDQPVQIELSSFTALVTSQYFVDLHWTTQSETNVAGYYIYRNTLDDLNTALHFSIFISAANTSQETNYTFVDQEVETGHNYYYWLESIDLNGLSSIYGPIACYMP